ncbi:hypothetical protein Csa_016099 [Cucumis sativus]|nr:hypothetical protein Csa_016099 [Cucumis sativus]
MNVAAQNREQTSVFQFNFDFDRTGATRANGDATYTTCNLASARLQRSEASTAARLMESQG